MKKTALALELLLKTRLLQIVYEGDKNQKRRTKGKSEAADLDNKTCGIYNEEDERRHAQGAQKTFPKGERPMKCMTCGQELEDGMSFCFRCGASALQEEEKKEEKTPDPVEEATKGLEGIKDDAADAVDKENKETDSGAAADEQMENDEAPAAAIEEGDAGPSEAALEVSGDREKDESADLPDTCEVSPVQGEESAVQTQEGYSMPTPIPLTRLRSAVEENASEVGPMAGGTEKRTAVTFQDLREKLINVGGSGKMLFLCIFSTLQLAVAALAGIAAMIASITAVIRSGGKIGGGISTSFPSIFAIAWLVLIWILCIKCRKRASSGYKGILETLRVFMIVDAVITAIGAAFVFLGAIFYLILPAGLLFASQLGSAPPEGFPVWLVLAFEPILLICCAAYILLAVYYGKAAVFFGDVISVVSERVRPIRTGYLRFFCWLQVVTGVLGAMGFAALIGSGKALVRFLSSIPTLNIPSDVASQIVSAVAILAAVSAVGSLAAAVSYFIRERLFKAAADVTKDIPDPKKR